MTATNVSALEIHQHLGSRYHVVAIVTSHDPERIYFSENTSIGEMLLICRRWPSGKGQKPPTKVVNLAKNPATPAEAMPVAWAIGNSTVESQDYGTVQEWPAHKIAAGDWGAVQFFSPYLCEEFASLSGKFFSSSRLGEISGIGPAGQRIRDAYTKSAMPDSRGRVALWQHDTEITQSMAAKADTHIQAKPDKLQWAENYWQKRSRLLLPTRARLNTVRVLGVKLNSAAVGSAWTPCRIAIAGMGRPDIGESIVRLSELIDWSFGAVR